MNASTDRRLPALLSFLLVLLLLAGCSGTGDRREDTYTKVESTGAFPVPAQIQPNVDFWRNVYSKWGRRQVALHDEVYLGVVYEVIDLPGTNDNGYTPDQKSMIQGRKSALEYRLRNVQDKTRNGQPLSSEEAALRDRLVAAGGSSAIYGADDRVRAQRGLKERFRRGIEISGRYEPAFREAFQSAGLPEDLVYLPHVESSYQLGAVSSAGATGVWQFMPATGRSYMHVGHAVDERLDPVVSAKAAARYLGDAHNRLGTWPLAITSYNHGVGGMARAKAEYGNDFGKIVRNYQGKYFGFASRNYYAEFLAAREIADHPDTYFPGIVRQAPLTEDRIVLPASVPATRVAAHYGVSLDRLSAVNLAWREPARNGNALLPAGHTVWLPTGATKRVAGLPSAAPAERFASFEPPASPAGPSKLVVAAKSDWPRPVQGAPEARTQKAAYQPAKPIKVATTDRPTTAKAAAKPAAKPVVAKKATPSNKTAPKTASKAPPKAKQPTQHVVKAKETLYSVATRYDMSVDQLRKLNGMSAKDTNIRSGQRLRVGI